MRASDRPARSADVAPADAVRREREVKVPVQDGIWATVFVKSQGPSAFVGFAVYTAEAELLKFDCSGALPGLAGHYHLGVAYAGHPAGSRRFPFPEADPRRQVAFAIHFYRCHLGMITALHDAESVREIQVRSDAVEASCVRIGETLERLLPLATPDCFD